MMERTVFICESSKTLGSYSTEESDLSYREQIDKAKEDCLRDASTNKKFSVFIKNLLDKTSWI